MRFPSAQRGSSDPWVALTKQLLPSDALVVSLDRLIAFVRASEVPGREARVTTDPPPIFVSTQPAVLVILDGDPVMTDIPNTGLSRVLNTNWDLFLERNSRLYYLLNDKSWLVSSSVDGSFKATAAVPTDFRRLPEEYKEAREAALTAALAASSNPPRVIVSHKPAELIVVRGAPELHAIPGTQLSLVTNTGSDLFFHAADRSYYFLASGRWFAAASLAGPWKYATKSLPADFRQIPPDHQKARVLAAVPGTREAEDAILLAAIPRTAAINRKDAKADVQYAGEPQFAPIPGTSITYARNTQNDVLRVGDHYYLCLQGVWFVAADPKGPWLVADRVPAEIYSIPENSPKYNVTYVRIYDSTPSTIVVGYTLGYYGAYVSGGVVVWGTGYYYPPYVAIGVATAPVYWGACCYTYGASAWYNPATGVYARGSAAYGPYGGYGAAAVRTYNPNTGTYSAGYRATNPYASWGQGVVGNGSNWAQGGYQSTSRGTLAAGQTSKGGAGVAFEGAGGNAGYAARSASGDIYAGANGNVYKRDNGQWYQNQNGTWNTMDGSQLDAQRQQAAARDHGARNAEAAGKWRAKGGPGQGRSVEQRPRFQGRHR